MLAERRLAALFSGGAERFTSDLPVAGLALARPAGLRPIAQVMGACAYHAKYATNNVSVGGAAKPGNAYRLPGACEPWNAGREKALDRLAAEGRLCGADSVVGVLVRQTQHHLSGAYDASVESVATGTAVTGGLAATGAASPVLTSLSMQDYWKLLQQGYTAVGLVASTAVMGCKPSAATVQAEQAVSHRFTASRQTREIPEFTKGLREAHRRAVQDMHDQAARLGATGIVGVTIDRYQHTVLPSDQPAHQMIVVVHAFGTAITPSAFFGAAMTPGTAPPAAGGPLAFTPVTHVNRKGGTVR